MKTLSLLLVALSGLSLMSCNSLKNIQPTPFVKVASVRTTAYTHSENDHVRYKRKDAVGGVLTANKSAAADWSVFPVGTVLKIDGQNYEICDYGSALVTDKWGMPVVDIYQPSKTAMRRWGVKYFDNVKVVKLGDFQESAEILKPRLKYAHCRRMYNHIQEQLN